MLKEKIKIFPFNNKYPNLFQDVVNEFIQINDIIGMITLNNNLIVHYYDCEYEKNMINKLELYAEALEEVVDVADHEILDNYLMIKELLKEINIILDSNSIYKNRRNKISK